MHKKIFIVSKYFNEESSAQAIQSRKLALALDRSRFDVIVVTQGTVADKIPESPTPVVKLKPHIRDKKHLLRRVSRKAEDEFYLGHGTEWVRECVKFIRRSAAPQDAVVLTISTPYESHRVGLMLRREGYKWISYHSDPWPATISPPPYTHRFMPIIGDVQIRFAKKVLEDSDLVIATNQSAIKLIEERLAPNVSRKCHVVPHIGLPSNLERDEELRKQLRGFVVYAGSLTMERSYPELLQGFELAKRRIGDDFRGMLTVGLVSEYFIRMAEQSAWTYEIKHLGVVSAAEAQKIILNAQVLLLIEAKMDLNPFVPSKFADYMSSGNRILAVTSKGSTVDTVMQGSNQGVAVVHNSDAIADAVCKLMLDKSISAPNASPVDMPFSSESVSAKLNDVLNGI